MAVHSEWTGPLPPPQAIAEFNNVIPNGGERIFAEWEKEASHRRRFEQRALTAQIAENLGSRILAFVFALSALGGAVYMGSLGHDWLAGILGTTTIGMVVTSFILGRKQSE